MIKYFSNSESKKDLDPELQKWFADECNGMDASVVVAFIKDSDLAEIKKIIRNFWFTLFFFLGVLSGTVFALAFI